MYTVKSDEQVVETQPLPIIDRIVSYLLQSPVLLSCPDHLRLLPSDINPVNFAWTPQRRLVVLNLHPNYLNLRLISHRTTATMRGAVWRLLHTTWPIL